MKNLKLFCAALVVLATCLAGTSHAQWRGGGMRGAGGGSPAQLLQIPEVREQLELDEDQMGKLKELGEKLGAEMQEAIAKAQEGFDWRSASEEDRKVLGELMQKAMKEQSGKQREALSDVLLAHQMERLDQLRIQQMKGAALMDSQVAGEIDLSDDQKKKMQEIAASAQEDLREKINEIRASGDWGKMRTAMQEMQADSEKQMLAELTDQQKEKLEEMKGEAFEFPEPQWGGGRGGRGGRGRGGRPGGDSPRQRPGDDDAD